jgi:hypothetical protein
MAYLYTLLRSFLFLCPLIVAVPASAVDKVTLQLN